MDKQEVKDLENEIKAVYNQIMANAAEGSQAEGNLKVRSADETEFNRLNHRLKEIANREYTIKWSSASSKYVLELVEHPDTHK